MKIVLGIIALIVLFIAWRLYATVVGGRKAYRTRMLKWASVRY